MSDIKNKRVLLKLSGEALSAGSGEIYDMSFVDKVALALFECTKRGYEIAVVVGAGNIWRGRQSEDMDRTSADRMGMLATVMNALSICSAVQEAGVPCHVMSAIEMKNVAEPYVRNIARKQLRKVIIQQRTVLQNAVTKS